MLLPDAFAMVYHCYHIMLRHDDDDDDDDGMAGKSIIEARLYDIASHHHTMMRERR
jgi:hypothetical protein